MPTNVKVNDFVKAARSYVKEQLATANTNKNDYLTAAEAKKLPADLRDNFQSYKAAKHTDKVSVKEFEKSFADYVKAAAKRADANGDGVIDAKESQKLPKDLRDNFANYVKAGGTGGTTETGGAFDKKTLEAMKKDLETRYWDDNMDGTTELTRADLPASLKKEFDRIYKKDGFGEYEPSAYKYDFKGHTVYAIAVSNDGGMYLNAFDASGKALARGGASESGEFGWF